MPTFVDVTLAQNSAGSNLVVTTPAGVAVGDVMLAHLVVASELVTMVTPAAGWSPIDNIVETEHQTFLYGKVAEAADLGGATHTWVLSGSTNDVTACVAYTDCDVSSGLTSAINAHNAGSTGAAATSYTPPAIITTVDGSKIVSFFDQDTAVVVNAEYWSVADGAVQRFDDTEATAGNSHACFDKDQTTAGSVSQTATSANSNRIIGFVLALAPPSGGVTLQALRPDGDIVVTGWAPTPASPTTVFDKINDQSDTSLITGTLT